jgi:Type VI secretion system (T6SS), amidase effector protein 4
MPKPVFTKLWSSYPTVAKPCDGPWSNQCAIRLSVTLNAEGTLTISSTTYTEPKCAHGHARGAESLANWLWNSGRLGRPTVYADGATAKTAIADKRGIIFFKDCFTRDGSTVQTGDHIDLWQRGFTKTYNDPANKAKQVWFWEFA